MNWKCQLAIHSVHGENVFILLHHCSDISAHEHLSWMTECHPSSSALLHHALHQVSQGTHLFADGTGTAVASVIADTPIQ